MSYEMVLHPDPRLKQKSEDVVWGEDLRLTIGLLEEAIDDSAKGVSICGPQIGVMKRVVVITYKGYDGPKVLINPVMIERTDGMSPSSEMCLSLPNISIKLMRFNTVYLQYLDEKYQSHLIWMKQLNARIMQHEIDHLNGKTMLDRKRDQDKKRKKKK